ncbi:MAG: class I SAM-dependent methyltransferase [Christensenellales bacterium]|nr:SAM-dependent methyltransferase [Clostridiales bacterium]
MIHLDARLSAAADMFPVCKWGVDMAADHGKLACYLIQSGKCKRIIASDISPASVLKMNRLVNQLGLNESILIRQGDGWSVIDRKVDAVAILGLGGESIARILDQMTPYNGFYPVLILSAHTNLPAVRFKLQDRGYAPEKERIICSSGRYYHIIKACFQNRTLTKSEILLGYNVYAENQSMLYNYWKWKFHMENKKLPKQTKLLLEIKEKIDKCKPQ